MKSAAKPTKHWWFLPLLVSALSAQDIDRNGPAVSPFRGMRPDAAGTGLEVQVDDDTWWTLQAVAGVDTATLLSEAQRLCGRSAWKRLTEDLPALLAAMGTPVGDSVDLVLVDVAGGAPQERKAVPMTGANRQRLRRQNERGEQKLSQPPAMVSAADAKADLQQLRQLLDERFAYRLLRPVDLAGLLRAAEAQIGKDGIAREPFAALVADVLKAFGDGHTRLSSSPPPLPGFLPFLVQQVDGGHVAFRADRAAFVDPERPFVVALDGVPLERWLTAAAARAPAGSKAMQLKAAERGLRDLAALRQDLRLPAAERVVVRLRGPVGETDVALPIGAKRPAYGDWPRQQTGRDGDLGYLRLHEMLDDAAFLDGIDAAMQSFRDTRGLIIDVRGNGGGSRAALRRLMPYLLPATGSPIVGNVAAVVLEGDRAPAVTALANRGLYPIEWDGWTDAQRAAITKFLRTFQPEWKLPSGRFSPWHFLVLDRADNPKAFAYTGKVAVLIDRGCFSATDVFAAALGALPNVTLVGETTSGGSGRPTSHQLKHSQLALQISSMASFQPDGRLFEGRGVEPDVVVATRAEDVIGAGDAALAAARKLLR